MRSSTIVTMLLASLATAAPIGEPTAPTAVAPIGKPPGAGGAVDSLVGPTVALVGILVANNTDNLNDNGVGNDNYIEGNTILLRSAPAASEGDLDTLVGPTIATVGVAVIGNKDNWNDNGIGNDNTIVDNTIIPRSAPVAPGGSLDTLVGPTITAVEVAVVGNKGNLNDNGFLNDNYIEGNTIALRSTDALPSTEGAAGGLDTLVGPTVAAVGVIVAGNKDNLNDEGFLNDNYIEGNTIALRSTDTLPSTEAAPGDLDTLVGPTVVAAGLIVAGNKDNLNDNGALNDNTVYNNTIIL